MVIPELEHGVHEVGDGLVVELGVPAEVGPDIVL